MRVKHTALIAMEQERHTAILLTGTWVIVNNPDFWAHGMRGFIVRIERSIGYAFVQLDSRGSYAQVCVPFSDIEQEEN